MADPNSLHSNAAWNAFLAYCKHQPGKSSPVDAKMTLSQFQLLAKDLKLQAPGGSEQIQELFTQHASQAMSYSMPRLDYLSYLKLLQVVGHACRMPHVFQLLPTLLKTSSAPDDGLVSLVPELLARFQALEGLVGERPLGGLPVMVMIESLKDSVQAVRSDVLRVGDQLSDLESLREELRNVQQQQLVAQRQLTSLHSRASSSSGGARDSVPGTVAGVKTATGSSGASASTTGTPTGHLSTLAKDIKVLQEQSKVFQSQMIVFNDLQSSLIRQVEELKAQRSPNPVGDGSSSVPEGDWRGRLAAVEATLDRMRESGVAPPRETATRAELAVMQKELQTKVSELATHVEETLKQYENRCSIDYTVEITLPMTPNISTLTPAPPQGKPPPPASRTPTAATAATAATATTATNTVADAPTSSDSNNECEPSTSGSGRTWNPGKKPTAAALKEKDGDANAVAVMQQAQKRVQFTAEALAKAEAQEIQGRMSKIRSQVSRENLSSYDMEKVRLALLKLNTRVAALERLQRVVEQLNAVGECLEILDRRQKDHKSQLLAVNETLVSHREQFAKIEGNMENVVKASSQMAQVSQDATETIVELKMHQGSLSVLDERLAGIESLVPAVKVLQQRLARTNEDMEMRFRALQALASSNVPAAGRGFSNTISFNRSATLPGNIGAVADRVVRQTAQPGESLNLDSPVVRQPSQRTSFNSLQSRRSTEEYTLMPRTSLTGLSSGPGSGGEERWAESAVPSTDDLRNKTTFRPHRPSSNGLDTSTSGPLLASPVLGPLSNLVSTPNTGATTKRGPRSSAVNSSMELKRGPGSTGADRDSAPSRLMTRTTHNSTPGHPDSSHTKLKPQGISTAMDPST